MSTTYSRGEGDISLDAIRGDLENESLTQTQRKQAFEDLRRWLADNPDDSSAHELWRQHEREFGREGSTAVGSETHGEGFGAVGAAEREVEQQEERA
jgi:hypothetical protein